MLPNIVDVSAITGQRIVGRLTSWQTRNGPYNVEHLGGRGTSDDCLVFWWSPQHNWQAVNLTQKTGQKLTGGLTSWQTRNGPYNVEHVAGRNSARELIVWWWSPQHDWQAVNVTQKTGQHISDDVTSWQTMNGPYNVEHLAGRNTNGDLIVFWWSPQHDWQAVNVSQKTGHKIVGNVTSWQTRNGPYNVEHLAGRTPAGHLIVFWWSPQHDWQAVDVTQKTGRAIASDVTSWQTRNGPYNVEHLAGHDPAGSLLVFWWSPQHDWLALDVSARAGGTGTGQPASFQLLDSDGNAEMLATRGADDSLNYYWWKPIPDWEMADLTKLTGRRIYSDPEAWTTPSGDHIVEHLACEGDNHALLVFWFDGEIRREGISTERWVSVGPRNITCVILALACHPTDPNVLYAGAEFGGVWKTSNGGASWRPTMDDLINPCVAALAVSRSQPNMIYAGMSPGKVGTGGGTTVTLYRSDNGGASWSPRTATMSTFCRALALHPTNPAILYFGGDLGVEKSINGGASWTRVLTGDVDDLKIDVDQPETLYASVRGQGILESTDGGATWAQKGAGVTFTVLDDAGATQNAALDGRFRTLLAIGEDRRPGKHATRFVVAKIQGTILVSLDGAETWRVLPGTNHGYDGQNFWTSRVDVCPADEDFIVAGGSDVQFTLDAGGSAPTWASLPNSLHEDQQAIAFTPANPADFYFSNDGYVGLARNRGASSAKVSDGLVASQCFNVAVSQGPTLMAGCSTYHTGTIRTGRTSFLQWEAIDSPEGGLFEMDSTDGATMFGSPWGQNKLRRSQNGGSSWEFFDVATDDGTLTYIETLGIRPSDPMRMYASGFFGRLHFSTNGGSVWGVVMTGATPLLPDAGSGRNDGDFTFAYAPSNNDTVYLGTNDGHLWRTTTAAINGAGWLELNVPLAIGTGRIAAIAVPPASPDTVYVGYQIDGSPTLWRGIAQGPSSFQWTNVSGTGPTALPRLPVNALVIDPARPQRSFAATHIGVYLTEDAGGSWRLFGEGLPRVRIIDMQLRARTRMLYVAAYGRGIFRRRI
ncbi:MAG: hypothetical protein ACM4AI_08125 [Acidobacteriota bacterium]